MKTYNLCFTQPKRSCSQAHTARDMKDGRKTNLGKCVEGDGREGREGRGAGEGSRRGHIYVRWGEEWSRTCAPRRGRG